MTTIIGIFLTAVIVLGAMSGGREFGDTIKRGIQTLITLAILVFIGILVAENWDSIQDWLLQFSTQ